MTDKLDLIFSKIWNNKKLFRFGNMETYSVAKLKRVNVLPFVCTKVLLNALVLYIVYQVYI